MKKMSIYLVSILLLLMACEDYENESYTISEIDAVACALLQADTLNISIGSYEITDTSLVTLADTLSTLDSLDTLVRFTVRSDSSWTVSLPADTSYLLFEKMGTSINTIFYINRFLGTEINLQITASDGTIINPVDLSIALETIASCSLVKIRNIYPLGAGTYMIRVVRFKKDDSEIKKFNAVVLNEG